VNKGYRSNIIFYMVCYSDLQLALFGGWLSLSVTGRHYMCRISSGRNDSNTFIKHDV